MTRRDIWRVAVEPTAEWHEPEGLHKTIRYKIPTSIQRQCISNSILVLYWTSIGLELEVDWTCLVEKAGPSQPPLKGGVANNEGMTTYFKLRFAEFFKKKSFFAFSCHIVTTTDYQCVRVWQELFLLSRSYHTCDGNVTGRKTPIST